MSRSMSKIFVICALVAIIPLMIAGVALAAFHSVGNTATIEVYVDEVSPSSAAYAGVSNGDDRAVVTSSNETATLEISAGQTSTVTVNATYFTDAYNFVGWYAGTLEEYNVNKETAELISGTSLAIDMSKSGNYVAVYKVVRYTINGWSYLADPENDSDPTTEVPGAEPEYIYGETLPVVSYSGNEYVYAGWKVGDGNTRYTTATFGSEYVDGGITLTNPWADSTPVAITYVDLDGSTPIGTDSSYLNEVYTLKDPSELTTLEGGYRYYWTLSGNEQSGNITLGQESITLTLEREAITYTATLTGTDDLGTEPQSTTATFTVEDTSDIEEWFSLTAKYSFWEFNGISYNGTTYATADELVAAIKASAPESTTLTFTVDVTKNFETITVSYNFAVEVLLNYEPVYIETTYTGSYREITEDSILNVDSTAVVTEVIALTRNSESVQYYAQSGNGYVEVSISEIDLKIDGETLIRGLESLDDLTFNDLIELIYTDDELGASEIEELITSNGTMNLEIYVYFKTV